MTREEFTEAEVIHRELIQVDRMNDRLKVYLDDPNLKDFEVWLDVHDKGLHACSLRLTTDMIDEIFLTLLERVVLLEKRLGSY